MIISITIILFTNNKNRRINATVFLFSFWHYMEIRFEFDNFDNFDKCVRHFHFFSNNKILLNFLVAIIVKVVKVSKCQSVKLLVVP